MSDPDVEFFNKTLDKFLDTYVAKGCCSAISPCSHQQRDRMSICDTCKAAKIARAALSVQTAPR